MRHLIRFFALVVSLIIPFFDRKKIAYDYAMDYPGRLGIGVHLVHAFLAGFAFLCIFGFLGRIIDITPIMDKMWIIIPLWIVDYIRTIVLIERVLDSPYDSVCKEEGRRDGRY